MQFKLSLLTVIFSITLGGSAATLVAQDTWPEFRGTKGNGRIADGAIPVDFSESSIRWKAPVPGRAWSSPVVWGDQVWVTTATPDGKRMSAMCFDAKTGAQVFDVLIHENEQPRKCHKANTYASPTPAIEDGRIYVHFGSYGTSCLDTSSGKILWQRTDIECDHFRGPASSPILSSRLLMVALDGADYQFVIALDKQTGETVWRTPREIDYGTNNGDFKKAFSTAALVDVGGRELLVSPAAVATIAYNIADGKPQWTIYHAGMNASARPILTGDGTVLVSNGFGKLLAVDPTGQGDVTKTHVRYLRTKAVPHKGTLVLVDDLAFAVSDAGIATCFDARTGEEIWAKRLGGKFAASPITDGKQILALSESGTIHVFEASDQFRSLAKIDFADGFRASPAAVKGDLLLRSLTHLYRIRGAGETR